MWRADNNLWAVVLGPVIAGVTVGLILLAAPPLWHRLFPPPATRTSVLIFRPEAPFGRASVPLAHGLGVAQKLSGYCFLDFSSSDDAMPDTHRCFSKDYILDPCWTSDAFPPQLVVCIDSPWDKRVFELTVRRWEYDDPRHPLGPTKVWRPNDPPPILTPRPKMKQSPPWALELANGAKCVFVTGASDLIAGRRLNYDCGRGGTVIGAPDRTGKLWLVSYLAQGAHAVTQMSVTTAWY